MDNPGQIIDELILSIVMLKGVKLLVVFLLAMGYGLKVVPGFQNRLIPLVTVTMSTVLAPFFLGWPQPGDMDPCICCPDTLAVMQILMTGFLLGCGTWMLHAKLLKGIIDGKLFKNGDTKHFFREESTKTVDAHPVKADTKVV